MSKKKKGKRPKRNKPSSQLRTVIVWITPRYSAVCRQQCQNNTANVNSEPNSWKLRPPDVELKHANVRADMTRQWHFTFAASVGDPKIKHSSDDSPYQRRV